MPECADFSMAPKRKSGRHALGSRTRAKGYLGRSNWKSDSKEPVPFLLAMEVPIMECRHVIAEAKARRVQPKFMVLCCVFPTERQFEAFADGVLGSCSIADMADPQVVAQFACVRQDVAKIIPSDALSFRFPVRHALHEPMRLEFADASFHGLTFQLKPAVENKLLLATVAGPSRTIGGFFGRQKLNCLRVPASLGLYWKGSLANFLLLEKACGIVLGFPCPSAVDTSGPGCGPFGL